MQNETETTTPSTEPDSVAGRPTTMKAVVQDRYGSADVLRVEQIDVPDIGDDEVLIQVRAASLDRGVAHLMEGLPRLVRLMGFGLRAPKNPIRGREVAGIVTAIGKNVTDLHQGDEVFGVAEGSFAEYARAAADKVAPKPANLSFEQAAALTISASTALQGLRDHGKVESGQKVLVVGASGGVGTFSVQLAKVLGAEVTGVASTAKLEMVRSLGADHVVDYTSQDIASTGEQYDLILDIGGNRPISELRKALTENGTLVIVGGEGGGQWIGGIQRSVGAILLSPFVKHSLNMFLASENREDLLTLKSLAEAGQVVPSIDRSFSLGEAADAIRYMEEGHVQGKVVVTV